MKTWVQNNKWSTVGLMFAGDIGIGQTVTVTYSVKIKDNGTLGNAAAGATWYFGRKSRLASHGTNQK